MIKLILLATTLSVQTDTAGCGSYESMWVLDTHVTSVLTDSRHAEIRDYYALTQQGATASKGVVTDPAICEPLVQYFVAHLAEIADSAYLTTYGFHHAVMHFGDYRVLLIVPKDAPGEIAARRSYLSFFDLSGTYVATVSI